MTKITSISELARYKIGEAAWWIVLTDNEPIPIVNEEDAWMVEHHPKILFERGPYSRVWKYHKKLPKLHSFDFENVVTMLTTKFEIKPFIIEEMARSNDTGEFYYHSIDDEWMPESCLFDTDTAARREKNRILKMLRKWIDEQL